MSSIRCRVAYGIELSPIIFGCVVPGQAGAMPRLGPGKKELTAPPLESCAIPGTHCCFPLLADLHEEECHSVGPQRATELDVSEPGVQLTEVVQLPVLLEDQSLNALDLDVLSREELGEVEEAGLVFGFAVVAILYLALEGGKLYGFFTCAGMGTVDDGIS